MILRRLTEHVKAQNWFAVAIDFVIVVLGVFVGLQVQEWSGRRADHARERQLLENMRADLAIDRAQYADGMAFDIRRIGAANASLAGAGLPAVAFDYHAQVSDIVDYSFDATGMAAWPADRLDWLWTDIVIGFHPTPNTSTYDGMVGAGDLGIVRDRDIVRDIQLYHNAATTVQNQNDKILSIRETLMRDGAARGLAPYASTPAGDYYALIGADPELAASIRILATFVIFHHGEIQSADAHAARLEARLKRYLGGPQ